VNFKINQKIKLLGMICLLNIGKLLKVKKVLLEISFYLAEDGELH
jgi:hypothetical protein